MVRIRFVALGAAIKVKSYISSALFYEQTHCDDKSISMGGSLALSSRRAGMAKLTEALGEVPQPPTAEFFAPSLDH